MGRSSEVKSLGFHSTLSNLCTTPRTELQRVFFPPTYLDSLVTPDLRPGEKRSWNTLQVFVELRDETTLYIPFREASKVKITLSFLHSCVSLFLGLAMGWSSYHTWTKPNKGRGLDCSVCWRPIFDKLCYAYGGGANRIRINTRSSP